MIKYINLLIVFTLIVGNICFAEELSDEKALENCEKFKTEEAAKGKPKVGEEQTVGPDGKPISNKK